MHSAIRRLFRRAACRPLRIFCRHDKGSVALETALLSPIVFGIILATFELGILLLQKTALEAGVEEARRQIMTGRVQAFVTPGEQKAAIRQAFCSRAGWLLSCEKVYFDINAFSQFADITVNEPIQAGKFNSRVFQVNPGEACQIIVIRAYYIVSVFTRFMQDATTNLDDGRTVLAAGVAFKNEPYKAC